MDTNLAAVVFLHATFQVLAELYLKLLIYRYRERIDKRIKGKGCGIIIHSFDAVGRYAQIACHCGRQDAGLVLALMSRNARSRENGEFDKILPRLLAKAANVVNLAKLAMQWQKWQI